MLNLRRAFKPFIAWVKTWSSTTLENHGAKKETLKYATTKGIPFEHTTNEIKPVSKDTRHYPLYYDVTTPSWWNSYFGGRFVKERLFGVWTTCSLCRHGINVKTPLLYYLKDLYYMKDLYNMTDLNYLKKLPHLL